MVLPVAAADRMNLSWEMDAGFTPAVLFQSLEGREPATARHCGRVAAYCTAMSGAAGMGSTERSTLYTAARLHDVGRLLLPSAVVEERQLMSASEQAWLEAHSALGARLAAAAGAEEEVCQVILHHHERWDGTGYPGRLIGANTPPLARALAVADAFDQALDYRPYQFPQSLAAARSELHRSRGKRLDPAMVDAFLSIPAHVLDGLGAYFTSQLALTRPVSEMPAARGAARADLR